MLFNQVRKFWFAKWNKRAVADRSKLARFENDSMKNIQRSANLGHLLSYLQKSDTKSSRVFQPAQAAFGGLRGQRVQNPMQAWMAAWAPIYGQQAAASGFAGYPVRGKRAVDPQSEAEMAEFAEKVADFKEMKKDNIGNLSCVLSKMGAFDDNLNIRLTHFTNEIWAETARGEEQEPEFIKQMNEGFQNCYQLSQSIPQDLLARKGKFYEQFGRQKMFFKCKKVSRKLSMWKLLATILKFFLRSSLLSDTYLLF